MEGEQSEGDKSLLSLRLRGPAAPGLVWLETQHGVMLSPATPLLILPAGLHDLAADVLRIVSSPAKQEAPADSQRKCCDGFLADLGLVISQAVALPGPAGSTLEHPAEQLTCAAAQPGPPVSVLPSFPCAVSYIFVLGEAYQSNHSAQGYYAAKALTHL